MNEAFSEFQKERDKLFLKKKEEKADTTLRYYNKIIQMIGTDEYPEQEDFLYSVQQFIEGNQFISDKQMEVIDRIFDEHENKEYRYEHY